jgi:hypothetical protein
MEKLPTDDARLAEAMEACRPGSDDLSDPGLAILAERLAAGGELKEVFDRLQQVDGSLAEAFRDVPVPGGLADRITARLAAADEAPDTSGEKRDAGGAAPSFPIGAAAERPRRLSRRWLLGAAGGVAAAAASIVVAIIVLRPTPATRTASEVWDGAIVFFVGETDMVGKPLAETAPPEAYPPAEGFDDSRFPGIRWRPVRDFLGLEGVAYDLGPLHGAPRATLYVVRCGVPGLGTEPPLTPSRTTRNCSVGAWQADGLLNVLVVDGPPRTYQNFLRGEATWIVAWAF